MIIRPPAVAGTLYDADTHRLLAQVEAWLNSEPGQTGPKPPKAIIVPHSNYHYSGAVAAKAYRLLDPIHDQIRRVILLGPSHRKNVRGIALPGDDIFRTPLGDVPVDRDAAERLLGQKLVTETPDAHRLEHSLEVQLPFLQTALEDFSILPLVVGDSSTEDVTNVLEALSLEDDSLVVISSGMSRHLPEDVALEHDSVTAERIRRLEPVMSYEDACGFTSINGFLQYARARGLDSKCLSLSTSALHSGHRDRVRGFGAFAFF